MTQVRYQAPFSLLVRQAEGRLIERTPAVRPSGEDYSSLLPSKTAAFSEFSKSSRVGDQAVIWRFLVARKALRFLPVRAQPIQRRDRVAVFQKGDIRIRYEEVGSLRSAAPITASRMRWQTF